MDKVEELLTRGVEKIYPTKEELEKVLRSGKKLKLYQGFDPTGIQLHIGHMVGLRKLRQWQDLGHHVIFLIGDGTGQAGDPSGKKHAREKFLDRDELRKNSVDYIKQAGKIVRFEGENPVEVLFNGDWLNKLNLVDMLSIMDHLSFQQIFERDLFQERIKNGEEIKFREFFYPLLQGYDSVAMEVDLELGGSDQTFNMLVGRKLVAEILHKDKFVMTTPLLTDSQGVKIGKTEGNVIALTDKPEDLFGKIMALPDDVIVKGLEYLTDVSMEEINSIEDKLNKGENPVAHKKKLAFEIVKQLNDDETARKAQENFEQTVQGEKLPDDIPVLQYNGTPSSNIAELLVQTKLAKSKTEAKRLIEQHGVSINGQTISDPNLQINITNDTIIRVGKRKFIKIKLDARR